MPDVVFRIRSEGDIKSFLTSVGAEAQAFMSRTNREMERVFRTQYGNIFSGGFGAKGAGFGSSRTSPVERFGPAVREARIEFDKLNNTMRITGDMGIRLGNTFMSTGQVTTITGNLTDYEKALRRIANARVELANSRRIGEQGEIEAARRLAATTTRVQSRAAVPYNRNIADVQRAISREIPTRSALATEFRALRAAGDPIPTYLMDLATRSDVRMRDLRRALRSETTARDEAITAATTRSTAVARGRAEVARAEAETQRLVGEARREIGKGIKDERAAIRAAPQLPANIQSTLETSKQLETMLRRAGLGRAPGMGADFTQNVVKSAQFNAPYLDLVRGVTKVGGEFINAKDQVVRFGAEIDKNGRIITRFGSNLSGMSNFLRMIQRDFVKVIEWTVATTVVFASMGAAIGTMRQINEVDKLLQRFAITAQMTATETRAYFSELAKVAYETATPLNEMIKVADDMALATKKAGQSTAEWTRRISEMSAAVGILTNIAGMETVAAADVLTSTMKQLGLDTSDLVSVLNKVSAVAGGQQQAISDITKGLAVMAEAGKQAGLTIDQQIATVQVLGQVTSKSSAEVATAFKNLVGSIDSPAAIKMLKQFNIEVRDSQGNARNFLAIYKDISDAVQKGIIPEGRLKEVIRAISGGPRRAPDAAALLANINTIYEVEQQSIKASNEALLANAKILETNNAKLTQLKVKIDQIAFEKFALALREATANMADFFTKILDFIDKIPTNMIQMGITVLAGVAAFKLLAVAMRGIANFIRGIGIEVATLSKEIVGLGIATRSLAPNLGGNVPPINPNMGPPGAPAAGGRFGALGRLVGAVGGKNLVGLGIGAALGGGLTAATGGTPGQMIGGLLQGAGMAAFMIPGATAAAVALTGLGTAMQFLLGETQKETKELNANTEAILNATTAYGNARSTIDDLTARQGKLTNQLAQLKGKQDIDSINARTDAQQQLADVTAELFNANVALVTSYEDLNKALAEGGRQGALGNLTPGMWEAARQGRLSDTEIKAIQKELELAYLKQAYPGQYFGTAEYGMPTLKFGTQGPGTAGAVTTPTGRRLGGARYGLGAPAGAAGEPLAQYMDISDVTTNLDKFKGLFSTVVRDGKVYYELTANVNNNMQTSAALWGAVAELSKTNAEEAERFALALQQAGIYQDNITQAAIGYQRLQAYLNTQVAFGNMKPEEAAAAQAQYRVGQNALTLLEAKRPTVGGKGFLGLPTVEELKDYAVYIASTEKSFKTLQEFMSKPTKQYFQGTQEYKDLVEVLSTVIPSLLTGDPADVAVKMKALGVNVLLVGEAAQQAAQMSEEFIAAQEEMAQQAQGTAEKLAEMSASLWQQYLDGDLTAGQYKELSSRVKDFTESMATLNATLVASPDIAEQTLGQLDEFNLVGKEVLKTLSQVPGFEAAAGMSIKDLSLAIMEYGLQTNLSSEKARYWGQMLLWLNGIINAMTEYKLTTYEVRTVFTTSGIDAATGRKRAGAFMGVKPSSKMTYDQWLKQYLKEHPFPQAPKVNLPSLGAGGGGGGGGGSQVGALDIPKEFALGDHSIRWYVNQAIAWARKYQRAVPGEAREHAKDIVAIMNGNNRLLLQRGISEEYLRKAMDKLAEQIKKQNDLLSKANAIQRIRVGAGDFAAIANVPLNAKTGISVGGPGQPININLNINGQVMTPAQLTQLANAIAAQIKKSYANS